MMALQSNLGHTQNYFRSPSRHPEKVELVKGTPKKCNRSENINVNVASDRKVQQTFFNTIQPASLAII